MTGTGTVRAVGLTEYGAPGVLHEVDVPAEPLGPDDVRIRVRAAAVSPTDLLLRSGARANGQPPKSGIDVPGMDIAGDLIALGANCRSRLSLGDRVMGIVLPAGLHGAYRADLVLPASSVSAMPAGVSYVQAATLPMNGLTARLSLDVLSLDPGQVLAVTGAAGVLGGYVIQLAKVDGLTVVADASPVDEQLVRGLGADVVVLRGEDFAERVRTQYPHGVDGLVDGALLDAAALPAVKDGGAVATVRRYAGDGRRGLRVTGVLVVDYAHEWPQLDRLRRLVETDRLTLRVAASYRPSEAAAAHERLEAGGTRGRLVLTFD